MLFTFAYEAAGASDARLSLRPLYVGGAMMLAGLGGHGLAGMPVRVIAGVSEAIQFLRFWTASELTLLA
jgi:hypothetical protein